MTTEVVVVSDDSEPEVTTEVVESLLDAAISDVIAEVTADEHHDDNVALLAGVAVATLDALTGRVDELETRTLEAEVTADVALEAVIELAEEANEPEPPIIEEIAETVVEPDEPPATRRNRFNAWYFGKK